MALAAAACSTGTASLPPGNPVARPAPSAIAPSAAPSAGPSGGSSGGPSIGPSAGPSTPSARTWTEADLQAALLTVDDLPAGFTEDTSEDTGSRGATGAAACNSLIWLLTSEHTGDATAEAGVGFAHAPDPVYLSEDLAAMPVPASSTGYLDEARSATSTCSSVQADLDGNGLTTVRASTFDPPKLGDDTVGLHLSAPASGISVDVVLVAAGPVVLVAQSFGAERSDTEAFAHDAYVKLATGRAPGRSGGSSGTGTGGGSGGQPA
jgi:hypothetical protein